MGPKEIHLEEVEQARWLVQLFYELMQSGEKMPPALQIEVLLRLLLFLLSLQKRIRKRMKSFLNKA